MYTINAIVQTVETRVDSVVIGLIHCYCVLLSAIYIVCSAGNWCINGSWNRAPEGKHMSRRVTVLLVEMQAKVGWKQWSAQCLGAICSRRR